MTHRTGHVWTADKLEFLGKYMPAFIKACTEARKWGRTLHYVDGFAGPGINDFNGTKVLGSPLLALDFDFDQYHFVEVKKENFRSLEQLVNQHQKSSKVATLLRADFNVVAKQIVDKIPPKSPTLFFLDPEGLEVHWDTIQCIASREKADCFILVSGMGVNRNWHNPSTLTRFFGSEKWRDLSINTEIEDLGKDEFGRCIDLYSQRLEVAGLVCVEPRITARLKNKAKLHAFIFASKREVANKIATDIIEKMNASGQEELF